MSGALAWQVKKTLIKSLFFVFEEEMVRGFARLSPSCVLRLFFWFFGFLVFWFFLDFILPNSLFNPIRCSSCLYLSLEWMILHRFEQIRTSTRQLFVFIKQANARMGLAHHDYSVQEMLESFIQVFLEGCGQMHCRK